MLVMLAVLVACAPLHLDVAHAGGSGFAASDLVLVDGRYMSAHVTADPPILRGDADVVRLEIVMVDEDADPPAPVSDIGAAVTILGAEGKELLEIDVYSYDGTIVLDIIPDDTAADRTSGPYVTGQKTDDGTAWLASSGSAPMVRAPVFLEGGLFDIIIDVKSVGQRTVLGPDLGMFAVSFSMGQFIPFSIDVDGAPADLVFATYHDGIDEFSYDARQKRISASMPFEWNADAIGSLPFLHAEYYIPKKMPLFEANEIALSVNGIPYFSTVDRSGADDIVVHFLISSQKLLEMLAQISSEKSDYIIFELQPGKKIHVQGDDASLEAGDTMVILSSQEDWKFYVSLGAAGAIRAGADVMLDVEFRDPVTNIVIPLVTYDIDVLLDGSPVYAESGREAPEGRDSVSVWFADPGAAIMRISNVNEFDTYGEIAFQVRGHGDGPATAAITAGTGTGEQAAGYDLQVGMAKESFMPGCERTSDCFDPYEAAVEEGQTISWINLDALGHTVASGTPGKGTDGVFESPVVGEGWTYLHTFDNAGTFEYYCTLHPWMTGVVIVSAAANDNDDDDGGGIVNGGIAGIMAHDTTLIPDWVRSSAQWWSEGLIDDAAFAGSLEFLMGKGLIVLPARADGDPDAHYGTAGMPDAAGPGVAIPDWVRSSAQWWSEGLVSDAEFVGAMQWMIANGVIAVPGT